MDELGLDVQLRVEIDRFHAAMQAAGDDIVKFGADADRGTKRAYDSFRKLEAGFEPASRALERLQKDTARVELAFMKGSITTERAAKVQKYLNDQYQATITRLGGVDAALGQHSAAMGRAAGSSNKMGFAVQNAGYQIGDFAVQVASGQGVLRPFIQQGTQLVSMFGPWGAVIGAAGAVVGALATSLMGSSKAADQNKIALDLLDASTKALDETTTSANESARQAAFFKLRDAEAADALARSELSAAKAILARKESDLAGTNIGGAFVGSNPLAEKLGMQVDAAREKIADLEGALDVAASSTKKFRDELSGVGSEINSQIADQELLISASARGTRAREIEAKTLEILRGKFAGTEDAARALATQYVDNKKKLDDLTAGQKAATKESEKQTKAIEAQTATFNDYIAGLKSQNTQLQNEINGRKDLNPLLKAEFELKKSMKVDTFTPEQQALLEKEVAIREKNISVLDAQKKAAKELEDQAKKSADATAKAWERASENIQDALADTFLNGGSFFDRLKELAKKAAAEAAAAWIIGGQNASGGFMGAIQSAMSGGGGSSGGSALSNLGSMFGTGGQGGGFSLSSIGSSLGSLFGGGTTATAAAQAAGTVGAHAAPYVANATGAGAGGSLTGAASAAYAIPVWGWIAAAAATVKGFVQGADPKSAKGAISTLLGPSLEEWQSNPRESAANAMDPLGYTLTNFGLPKWLSLGGIMGSLFGTTKPSNMAAAQVTNYANQSYGTPKYNPSEASQENISAVQNLTTTLLDLEKMLVAVTGGSSTGVSTISVGSRDGLTAGFGTTYAETQTDVRRFANSPEGAQQLVDYLSKRIAENLSGVTDPLYQKALQGTTASNIAEGVQFVQTIKSAMDATEVETVASALKEVSNRYAVLINKSRQLGLAMEEVIELRDKEYAAIRKGVADQRDAFQTNLWERVWTLQGNDEAVLRSQLDTAKKSQLESAKVLLDAQIITAAQYSSLGNILDQEIAKSLKEFNANLQGAASAMSAVEAAGVAVGPISNVTNFIKGLMSSDLSPLTVAQKAALAQTEFDRVSALAAGGDITAVGQFNDAAQILLQLERQLNGSGSGYLDAYNKVVQAADAIGSLDPNELIASTIEASTQTQTQALVEALAEIREAVASLKASTDLNANKPAMAA